MLGKLPVSTSLDHLRRACCSSSDGAAIFKSTFSLGCFKAFQKKGNQNTLHAFRKLLEFHATEKLSSKSEIRWRNACLLGGEIIGKLVSLVFESVLAVRYLNTFSGKNRLSFQFVRLCGKNKHASCEKSQDKIHFGIMKTQIS